MSVCAQELEARLDEARRPFVACVGDEARLGRLSTAHRCFRALRLLESGRWWLRTLTGEAETVPTVYGVTREPVRLDFLCRLERLALARSAPAVEERYLEMIRAYP
ncbi:MAG: hypothetical protein IT371_13445 [Deltaproteobacteria bacterium]|nr:hypothetical protein [Deltaproteobacteria bacterium]